MDVQEARELGNRIAERLFLGTYDLELEEAEDCCIWAYRKAAWAVDEWPQSIAEVYQDRGEAGLWELPGVGKRLAGQIARWLLEENELAEPQALSIQR